LKRAPSGGRGGYRLGANTSEKLWAGIEHVCVERGLKPGGAKAIAEIRSYLLSKGWQGKPPTSTTLSKYSRSERIMHARENAYVRDHLNVVIGKPAESLGLMSVVQLDTTEFTNKKFEWLVVDAHGRSLGPANVIFGVLGSNRGVWTFLPFVGPANRFLSGIAIKRGLLSKEGLLNQYGVDGVFSYCGKVGAVHHDNGSEYIAHHVKRVMKDMNIGFDENAAAGTPHYRGKEERFNRTAHWLFDQFLASGLGKRYLRPVFGKKGAKGILFSDLERALLEWIVTDYHTRAHKGLGGDSPNSRFEKLVEGRDGLPSSGLSLPLEPSQQLNWDFLCEESRVVNHLGITWENRIYRLPALNRLFAVNRRSSLRRIPFRFNPYSLKSIFIMIPDEAGVNQITEIPWIPETEKYPMTEEKLEECLNPSIWQWRVLYADLVRAGHAKPSSGLVEALHQKRRDKIEATSEVGAPSGSVSQTDNRNHVMSASFGANDLPIANVASVIPEILSKTAKTKYQPVYLSSSEGHDAY
jgi:hypothetical protein